VKRREKRRGKTYINEETVNMGCIYFILPL
jgi:hypothetical protein